MLIYMKFYLTGKGHLIFSLKIGFLHCHLISRVVSIPANGFSFECFVNLHFYCSMLFTVMESISGNSFLQYFPQRKRHFWRLDPKTIILYLDEKSSRYYKVNSVVGNRAVFLILLKQKHPPCLYCEFMYFFF